MENVKRNILKIRALRDSHKLLFSAVFVFALLLLTWLLVPIIFETNDDAFLMGCVSGGRTGKPEANTIFSLFLWGRMVSALYMIHAGIPWYTLSFLILIDLSLTAVCYCCVTAFPKWGGSMFCLLYFGMFIYYSVIIQFTLVSAYCGIAAISLMLIEKKEECSRKDIVIKNILIFLFMFFSVNIRSKVGYLVLGSAAAAVCFEVLRYFLKASDRQKVKKMALSFLVICSTVIISVGIHKIHEALDDWGEFREYHAERANFTDYSKLDYESNKELFDEIGWSEKFYVLAKGWFFMDERISTESFRKINERNVHEPIDVGFWYLHDNFPKIELQIKVWVVLLLFLLADALWHRKGGYGRNIVSFLWLFVWLAETLYFAHGGRMMERVVEAWTLLAVIPSILGMAGNGLETDRERKESVAVSAVVSVLALMLCVKCVRSPYGGLGAAGSFSHGRSGARTTQANGEDYAMAHPENLYIYEPSLSKGGGPWRVYPKSKPYNLISWGGSYYNSPLYYEQLRQNGFEHIYEEDFFRENVYFMAGKEPNEKLIDLMEEKFPGCTYEITDEGEGFIVYKFYE